MSRLLAPLNYQRVTLGYVIVRISQFISNPLRCFKCQQFGHGQLSCHNKEICFRCGREGHDGKDCTEDPRCKNCQGGHMASSKDCPRWKTEKEIVTLKCTKNISFYEAKALHAQNSPSTNPSRPSYAKVATKILKSIECQTEVTWLTPEPKKYISKPQPTTSKTNSISCQTEPIQFLENPTPTSVKSTPIIKPKTSTNSNVQNSNPTNSSATSSKNLNTTSSDTKPKSKEKNPKKQDDTNKHSNRSQKGDDSIKIHNSFNPLSDEEMETSETPNTHSRSSRSRSPKSRSRDKHKLITPISGP